MYNMKLKKVSAAAITAVLAMAGASVCRAAGLPYHTGFEPSPGPQDVPAVGYNTGNLVGQNGWAADQGTGAQTATDAATVVNAATGSFGGGSGPLGTQSVRVNSTVNSSFSSDFYTSTVSANGTPLNPASSGGVVQVSFNLQLASPNTGGRSGENTGNAGARGGFGMDILSPTGGDIASIFLRPDNTTNGSIPFIVATTTGNGTLHNVLTPGSANAIGAADDNWGTYTLRMDFNANTFSIFSPNSQNASYGPFTLNDGGSNSTIGEIGFAADNIGVDTAFFDNLTVAPEPTGVAMVGVGTLLLLAKRPKKRLA